MTYFSLTCYDIKLVNPDLNQANSLYFRAQIMDCLFCKIAEGKIPAKIFYEDDEILAFDDVAPKAPTHKLIIPKQHIATLNDLNENQIHIAGKLLYVAQQLAKELGHAEDGYRVVMNCNKGAGQSVFHIHLHLLGGRLFNWPPG